MLIIAIHYFRCILLELIWERLMLYILSAGTKLSDNKSQSFYHNTSLGLLFLLKSTAKLSWISMSIGWVFWTKSEHSELMITWYNTWTPIVPSDTENVMSCRGPLIYNSFIPWHAACAGGKWRKMNNIFSMLVAIQQWPYHHCSIKKDAFLKKICTKIM